MSDNYAAALAALAAAREQIETEFAEAKASWRADPGSGEKKARYAAARDALQSMRAVDRAGRTSIIGGDAVKEG